MKKIFFVLLLFLFFMGGSILGYVFAVNTKPEVITPSISVPEVITPGISVPEVITPGISVPEVIAPSISTSDLSVVLISDFDDELPKLGNKLSIINLQKLLEAKSVPIDNNDDPGTNPSEDHFGILGKLHYPLREMEITDTDEIVIIIKPHPELKPKGLDAYIACNTEVLKRIKDEFCYFSTRTGTTPLFSISIYKNGYLIEDSGVFGLHLSELDGEFKSLKRMNDVPSSDVAAYISCEFQ